MQLIERLVYFAGSTVEPSSLLNDPPQAIKTPLSTFSEPLSPRFEKHDNGDTTLPSLLLSYLYPYTIL